MKVFFEELVFIGILLVAAFFVATLFGDYTLFVYVGFVAYAAWHISWIYMVYRFVSGEDQLPDIKPWGAWGLLLESVAPKLKVDSGSYEKWQQHVRSVDSVLENLPVGVLVLSSDFVISSLNRSASELLELNSAQDIGHSVFKILRQPDIVGFFRNVKAEKYQTNVFEFSPSHNPQLILVLEVSQVEDSGFLVAIYDVTEQRNIDTMRRDFIANISHEIRTPLSVIKGQSELIAEFVNGKDHLVERAANAIESQVTRLTALSDDLIRLTQLESHSGDDDEEEMVNLITVLATLFNQLDGLYPENTKINFKEVAEVGIKMRYSDIVSIFENLITNSARYVHDPAAITVKTQVYFNGDMRLDFSDNGEGIAAEHLSRLTERFYRVDSGRAREEGGTGLGLAIVKHAMRSVGGNINIYSKPTIGTTITLLFPASCLVYST